MTHRWLARSAGLASAGLAGAGLAGAEAAALLAGCTSPAQPAAGGGAAARAGLVAACSTAVAPGRVLAQPRVSFQQVPQGPFDVVVTAGGHWAFVSLAASIGVYRLHPGRPAALVRQIPVAAGPAGEAITPDGQYLVVAAGHGATVIRVRRAEEGGRGAVAGTLSMPGAQGPIEVTLSPGGTFAFVSVEYSDALAVFDLCLAAAHDFNRSGYVGAVPLGQAVVGSALAPGGQLLYVTSELAGRGTRPPGTTAGTGTLSVISVPRAETTPARAVTTTVTAGCQPVRVITSGGGRTVWVTARASDALLAFSAARLLSNPARALIARVSVGEEPVGLALTGSGQQIVVADSDRFVLPGQHASLAVVNVAAALRGEPALAGYLPAGAFPREEALEPGGRVLLVTNYQSGQLETVPVSDLP